MECQHAQMNPKINLISLLSLLAEHPDLSNAISMQYRILTTYQSPNNNKSLSHSSNFCASMPVSIQSVCTDSHASPSFSSVDGGFGWLLLLQMMLQFCFHAINSLYIPLFQLVKVFLGLFGVFIISLDLYVLFSSLF